MVVELFYLLAFVMGLGAFFAVFVIGSKRYPQKQESQAKSFDDNSAEAKDIKESPLQEQSNELRFKITKEQKRSVIISQYQKSQPEVFYEKISTQGRVQPVRVSKIQQAVPSQIQRPIQKIQNCRFPLNNNLPEIIEASSEIEGQSKLLQESEVSQKQNNHNSSDLNNERERKTSFIQQLNDDNVEQKHQTEDQQLYQRRDYQEVQEAFFQEEQRMNQCSQMSAQVQQVTVVQLNNQTEEQKQNQTQRGDFLALAVQSQVVQSRFQTQQQRQQVNKAEELYSSAQNYQPQQQMQSFEERKSQRIDIQKSRVRSRLQAMKNHYKRIIFELQNKLEQVCVRNNESFSVGDANQTITFSEGDSVFDQTPNENQAYFLELKVEEVCTLKEQLKLQEQIITSLLEKDLELKQKLGNLQQQNKHLKESAIVQQKTHQIDLKASDFIQRVEKEVETKVQRENLLFSQIKQPQIQKNNLYSSHVNFTRPQSNIFGSRAESHLTAFSTISMISVIQGAISIGLLNQCRFLNEISKKFAINQIKKATKQKFVDSEMIYSNGQIIDEGQQCLRFVSFLKEKENIIFLIKLQNGRTFAFYIKQKIVEQPRQQQENFFVFIDLNKRKSTVCPGTCQIKDSELIWGNEEIILKENQTISISSKREGRLTSSIEKTLELFQFQQQDLNVEFLYAYVLYPAAE